MSDGKRYSGQQFNPGNKYNVPFVKQMVAYDRANPRATGKEGQAYTEIIPNDQDSAVVTEYDVTVIQEDLDAMVFKSATYVNLQGFIPDELISITTSYTTKSGNGASNYPASQQASITIGSPGNAEFTPNVSADASASIICDVVPTFKQHNAIKVPAIIYTFYLDETTTLLADVLTKLTVLAGATVNAAPVFRPKEVILLCKGEQLGLSQRASTKARVAWSSSAATAESAYGDEYSTQSGVTSQNVVIPRTIHAALTITSATSTTNISTTVDASTTVVEGTGAGGFAHVDAIDNTPASLTGSVTGSVTPTSIAATGGLTAVPTSGLYLIDVEVSPGSDFGRSAMNAIVVDFAYFA